MVRKCAAQWCSNTCGSGFSVHKFPQHLPAICQQWVRFVRVKCANFKLTDEIMVCGKHFIWPDDYLNAAEVEWKKKQGYTVKRILKPNAVPSIQADPKPPKLKVNTGRPSSRIMKGSGGKKMSTARYNPTTTPGPSTSSQNYPYPPSKKRKRDLSPVQTTSATIKSRSGSPVTAVGLQIGLSRTNKGRLSKLELSRMPEYCTLEDGDDHNDDDVHDDDDESALEVTVGQNTVHHSVKLVIYKRQLI